MDHNEPIVDLYMELSPPCYNQMEQYYVRGSGESKYMFNGECVGDYYGTQLHPEFIESGYSLTEEQMYRDNELYNRFLESVPDL